MVVAVILLMGTCHNNRRTCVNDKHYWWLTKMKFLASFTWTYWNTPIISVIKDTCAFPSMTLKTSVIKKHFLIRQKHDNNFLNSLTPWRSTYLEGLWRPTPTASAPHMAQGQLHAECGQTLRLIMHEREKIALLLLETFGSNLSQKSAWPHVWQWVIKHTKRDRCRGSSSVLYLLLRQTAVLLWRWTQVCADTV